MTAIEFVQQLTYQITKAGNNFSEGWTIDAVSNVTGENYQSDAYQIKRGGEYEVRAEVTVIKNINLVPVFSNSVYLAAKWPDWDEYIDEDEVQQQIEQAKENSIDAVSQRMEYGFYIYLRLDEDERLYLGDISHGSPSNCGSEAHVTITGGEASFDSDPTETGKYILASFHTHPPLTECSYDTKRIPGPSEDIDVPGANSSLHTWLILDYYEGLDDNGFLRGGHDKNAAMKIYDCGVQIRINPE